jgi:hypothetical protein
MYLAKTKGNLNPRGEQPQSNLKISTVRSFEGGLNITDTDLNMAPKFAKVLDNIERAPDGSLSIRPGTKFFGACTLSTANIVNHFYFQNTIITVQTDGWLNFFSASGTVTASYRLWTLSTVGFVSFTIFNGDLIICDGTDKPIIISGLPSNPNYMIPQFLIDLGTVTNINTPVGKYVIAHGEYTCIAGVAAKPSTLYVSARGTSGTYYGDPAPNDAIALDLGPRVSLGNATITGLVAYRDKLLVTFERGVLPITLGVYTGSPAQHTPSDDGFIEEFGCLAHRSLVSVGDDTFFCDNVGINSITRVNVFNTLRPVRASHLIDPMTTVALQKLSLPETSKYVFAVYDLRNFRYMLFVPTLGITGNLVESVCYSYTNIPTMKIQAWSRLRGWKWQSACRTALQNIVFSSGYKLYLYDFDNPDTCADLLYDDSVSGGAGVPIAFEWELPWADFKHRMFIKQLRYIALDTQGDAPFTLEAYVDNYTNKSPVPYNAPMLSLAFVGGGYTGTDTTLRRAGEERLYAWTTKLKLLKLRFFGSTTRKLKFVSISIAYVTGGIRR